jgi:hypothetical protein
MLLMFSMTGVKKYNGLTTIHTAIPLSLCYSLMRRRVPIR